MSSDLKISEKKDLKVTKSSLKLGTKQEVMEGHSYEKRLQAIEYWESGQKRSWISTTLGVNYDTLCEWIKRYKTSGAEGLRTRYSNCGKSSQIKEAIRERAMDLKRAHPAWGSGYIRVKLSEEFDRDRIPCTRQLQRYFVKGGLMEQTTRLPRHAADWVRRPLERVQVDAKERLETADGKPCCYLTYTDEHSGSVLDAFVFPLCTDQSGSSGFGI